MMKRAEKEMAKINTVIGVGTVVDGNLSTKETTRIDGKVNGDIVSEGNIIVGDNGEVQGSITAHSVFVSGKVNGHVSVKDKIDITATGSIYGDISTKLLSIDEKAVFQGQCKMNAPETKSDVKSFVAAKTAIASEKPETAEKSEKTVESK